MTPVHRRCPNPARWIAYLDARTKVADNGCHYFTGHVDAQGYGRYKWKSGGREQRIGAHRAAWLAKRGPIDGDLVIDHVCHTNDPTCPGGYSCMHRRCVNVDHMELVTALENWRRGIYQPPTPTPLGTRFATSATYPCGWPRTESNTYTRIDRKGRTRRVCRHCKAENTREFKRRQRATRRAA